MMRPATSPGLPNLLVPRCNGEIAPSAEAAHTRWSATVTYSSYGESMLRMISPVRGEISERLQASEMFITQTRPAPTAMLDGLALRSVQAQARVPGDVAIGCEDPTLRRDPHDRATPRALDPDGAEPGDDTAGVRNADVEPEANVPPEGREVISASRERAERDDEQRDENDIR